MDDAQLIERVRAKSALFDKKEMTEVLKKKWNYLRDYYKKQKKILGETKSGQAVAKKIKWPLFDAVSFLETFAECSITHKNFAMPGPSNFEPESTPDPWLEDSQEQLTQVGLDAPAAATDALPPPPLLPSKKRKKADSNNFDLQVLAALKEPENNDDPDGHLNSWKGLLPMLKQLNSLEALRLKHEVHGLLISYIERSQAKSSYVSTFHTVNQSSFPASPRHRTSPSKPPKLIRFHLPNQLPSNSWPQDN